MAKKFYFRSTNLASGRHTVTHEKEMNLEPQVGAGSALVSSGVAESASALLFMFTSPAGEPNEGTWTDASVSTPYSISWDISAAGANMAYFVNPVALLGAHVARVASDLSSESEAANWTFGSFSGTGIKTGSDTVGTAPTGTASDRVEIVIGGTNNNSMMTTETVSLDVDSADSWFEGPWTAAAPATSLLPPHRASNILLRL